MKKVYTCNTFVGHFPVGTAAVVVAESAEQAWVMLHAALLKVGLPGLNPPGEGDRDELQELDLETRRVRILRNGDY